MLYFNLLLTNRKRSVYELLPQTVKLQCYIYCCIVVVMSILSNAILLKPFAMSASLGAHRLDSPQDFPYEYEDSTNNGLTSHFLIGVQIVLGVQTVLLSQTPPRTTHACLVVLFFSWCSAAREVILLSGNMAEWNPLSARNSSTAGNGDNSTPKVWTRACTSVM